MAKLVRPKLLFPLSIVLAWIFDFLFWGKMVGVSFPIFTMLVLALGFWFGLQAGLKPARRALWLLLPILFLASVSAFRSEPLTLFASRVGVLMLMGLLALSFLGGQWPQYGFADYVVKLPSFIPLGLTLPRETGKANKGKPKRGWLGALAPVGRGLLFALPLLWFLTLLLSSADPYFADWLGNLLGVFDKLPEYLLRGSIILGLAYILAGAYLYSLNRSQGQELLGEKKPLIAPFIGFGEAATMLASVNVLFLAFVVVQFRYFFGGLSNIVQGPSGYTFAQYARRGFAELVVVAVVSLGFFILLSALSRRQPGGQQRGFSGLGIGLFVLVAVILISAFERLLLLEEAYGFSRLRTYPHVFMIWLGALLLAVVLLEAFGRQRAFALATFVAVLGFTVTLPLLNVDAFISGINIQRAAQGGQLDAAYLAALSDDVVPNMISAYQTAITQGNQPLAQQMLTALACHFEGGLQPAVADHWQSWNWSHQAAAETWNSLREELGLSQVAPPAPGSVMIGGQEVDCPVSTGD